ncbi:MFS transporter [Asticcacaulis sp. EMRT-3]|uniref:MFS transporter n=1 Tax=Asticcacaulis sp. EMRT-3 TaxID=3040349 RepID=UPI0024AF72B2|nr:MFS transporter [Asticcacaulis sp. EMRT-3]MDI7776632.1 MFS transporter [Asticcacaulis sp. EMRT-3]
MLSQGGGGGMLKGKGGIRWWIISLVMLGTVINYLTRSVLSVAAPTMMASLHMSEQNYGVITGVFQFGIMLQPVAGYMLDLTGLRLGLTLFAIAWGLVTMAHALAGNWQGLAFLRGLQGFAEGIAQPGGLKVVAEWFPARERGFASGIYNIGASAGSILAPPLVAWAILSYNWQAAFIISGGLALIWALAWFFGYQTPDRHKHLSGAERAYIRAGQNVGQDAIGQTQPAVMVQKPSPLRILRQRNFWGMAIARFLADPTWSTLVFWVPLYLSTARGFDLKHIALFAWLPFVAADLGCLFGPALALWLQNRGVSLINARRGAFTIGACMMLCVPFVGLVASPYMAIALLCVGAFAHQTLSVNVITLASDLFAPHEVATVAGMVGTVANLGALLMSVAMGFLVAKTGYGPFFMLIGGLDLIGAAWLWLMIRPVAAATERHP